MMVKKIFIYVTYSILFLFILIDIELLLDYFFNISFAVKLGFEKLIFNLGVALFVLSIPIIITYTISLFFKFQIPLKVIFGLIIINSLFLIWYIMFVIPQNII